MQKVKLRAFIFFSLNWMKIGMEMAAGNLYFTHALTATNKVSHVTGTDCMGHQYFITKI